MSGRGGSYSGGEPSRAEAVDGPGMSTAVTDSAATPGAATPSAATPGAATPGAAAPGAHPRRPQDRPLGQPKARRRRGRLVAVSLLLAFLGIAGGVTWALFDSSLFTVRYVDVSGTSLVPQSEVLAVAGIRPGTPLIRVSTAQIAGRVLTIRQVIGVRVTKSWPDRVIIAVRERTPVLAVALPGGGFDLIDANGVVVRPAPARPQSMPAYTTMAAASSLRDDPDVAAAAGVLRELPASLRSSVTSVSAPSPDQVTLTLGSGVTILWGGTDDAAAKARELTILMQTRARSYDVSSAASAVTY